MMSLLYYVMSTSELTRYDVIAVLWCHDYVRVAIIDASINVVPQGILTGLKLTFVTFSNSPTYWATCLIYLWSQVSE